MNARTLAALCSALLCLPPAIAATSLGTAFTYQGRLTDNGQPAQGDYDLRLILYDADIGGSPVSQALTNAQVRVVNGLFTTAVDFATNVFTGTAYWLELAVRTNGAAFTTLEPRQPLTPTPYALYAPTAGTATTAGTASVLTGALPASQLSGVVPLAQLPGDILTNHATGVSLNGSFAGDGSGLTALNASQLASGTVPDARLSDRLARLDGTNRFTGTNTFTGVTALTNANNLFSGDGSALTGLNASALGSGTVAEARLSTNAALLNRAAQVFDGTNTFVGPVLATNPGNQIAGAFSGSGAGLVGLNASQLTSGTVPLPQLPTAVVTNTAAAVTLGGAFTGNGAGLTNLSATALASGTVSDVRLGANLARTNQVWLLGGNGGTTPGVHFLGTTDNQPLDLDVNGQRALRLEPNTNGAPNVIGGSLLNFAANGVVGVTIGGGGATNYSGFSYTNSVTADFGTVGGGRRNTASGADATVGGGYLNTASSSFAAVGGGYNNIAVAYAATAPGGAQNVASGQYSFAAGRQARALHQGAFVWADSENATFASTASDQFLIRAAGGVGINKANPTSGLDVNGTVTASSFVGSGAGLSSVPSAALPANVAYLDANETFTGGVDFLEPVHLQNSLFVYDHNVFFRNDANHGVGWFGAGKPFGGIEPNGPVLFGYGGGALGSEQWGTEKVALTWDPSGTVRASGSVTIDQASVNDGSLSPGLIFGAASGEGISSKRTAGGNQYSLDFYTANAKRMSIDNLGNVGIGTTTPSVALEVAGSERVSGMVRIGSESGAAPASYPTGSEGLVIRRISSTSQADGTVVARTDAMVLARDGTASGLKFQLIGPTHYTYSATGFDRGSHLVALQSSGILPAGSYLTYPFDDSQKVVHYDISFGNPYNNGHTCHVVLDRYDDGITSDNYLVGTLTSTYNQ